jgi:hypothetical protein
MSTEINSQKKLEATWGADNIPPGSSLDIREIEVVEGIKRLPSARAALVHKLNVICRTCNPPEWNVVAEILGVNTSVLRKWRAWSTAPGSVAQWQRIDNCYDVALEKLKLAEAKKNS